MARFVDIDDERFWDILFDEACVEGSQAERIEKELEKIISFEEIKQAIAFKNYFMGLYSEGLEVANWHLNGDLEPLTEFIDSALEAYKID